MRTHILFSFLVLLILLQSCAYSVHLVHVSDFEPYKNSKAGKIIEARANQFVILGFTFDVNYVDKAYKRLIQKCSGGQIQGITTEYITNLGFFSWRNRIIMKGQCFKG